MTVAVCIACGEIKHGDFSHCQACGFTPDTALEVAMSLWYADHYHSSDALTAISKITKANVLAIESGVGSFVFDESVIPMFEKMLSDPSGRDPLTLHREARSSWLRSQINVHTIGPDGYESGVMTRGKEVGKQEFDVIRGTDDGDLYLVCTYEDGDRRMAAVPKRNWYIMRDLMVLAARHSQRKYLQLLNTLCETFLSSYLRTGKIS